MGKATGRLWAKIGEKQLSPWDWEGHIREDEVDSIVFDERQHERKKWGVIVTYYTAKGDID